MNEKRKKLNDLFKGIDPDYKRILLMEATAHQITVKIIYRLLVFFVGSLLSSIVVTLTCPKEYSTHVQVMLILCILLPLLVSIGRILDNPDRYLD